MKKSYLLQVKRVSKINKFEKMAKKLILLNDVAKCDRGIIIKNPILCGQEDKFGFIVQIVHKKKRSRDMKKRIMR